MLGVHEAFNNSSNRSKHSVQAAPILNKERKIESIRLHCSDKSSTFSSKMRQNRQLCASGKALAGFYTKLNVWWSLGLNFEYNGGPIIEIGGPIFLYISFTFLKLVHPSVKAQCYPHGQYF